MLFTTKNNISSLLFYLKIKIKEQTIKKVGMHGPIRLNDQTSAPIVFLYILPICF
jgi:hypothetical protein